MGSINRIEEELLVNTEARNKKKNEFIRMVKDLSKGQKRKKRQKRTGGPENVIEAEDKGDRTIEEPGEEEEETEEEEEEEIRLNIQ